MISITIFNELIDPIALPSFHNGSLDQALINSLFASTTVSVFSYTMSTACEMCMCFICSLGHWLFTCSTMKVQPYLLSHA
jgi:hypothetical protein